jgi:hypothetical protein
VEARGVPAVVLGTDVFALLARECATALGVPHLAVATVPHPLGGVDPRLIVSKAEAVIDQVATLLTMNVVPPAPGPTSGSALVKAPDDLDDFQEFVMAEEWGDGLPALPPTPERVERILGRLLSRRDEVVAALAPRMAEATFEAIAVNAALAGAGPEHLSVIVAALRAVTQPEFNLKGIQTTTHPCGPLVIVNGPIATRLGVASGPNALGGGSRASAVIGRAVRLTLMNVGGARPGTVDRATLGHPGKYTYCLAENEGASPWEPLHVERGHRPDESCVTVLAAEGPHNVNDHGSTTAEGLLCALAGTAATTGSNNIYYAGGQPLVVLGPEHARTIADSGWSKRDFKRAFWERARVPIRRFNPENLVRFATIDPARFQDAPPDREIELCATPDELIVVVAGGPGKHSAFIPTFGATRSVTARVDD